MRRQLETFEMMFTTIKTLSLDTEILSQQKHDLGGYGCR